MRILRLYYLLPPMKGGMEKHISYLSKYQNQDHFVSIYFNQGDKISANDVKIFPYLKFYKIRPLFIGIFIFYMAIVFKLLISPKKFDVIHIHGDWSSLVFVKILKWLTGAKVVAFTCHGIITSNYTHRKFLPSLLKNVNLIFTTGHESASMIQKTTGKEVIVQPSGVNDVFFEPMERSFERSVFTVVTVANLVAVKNIKLVLEIAKDLPHAKFLIIGKGPEKDKLNHTIQKYNLKNVELLGFKTPEEIKYIYDDADCFLLTSLAEGTPTSALEAMTVGLPIVSSNAGGINNVVANGVNGFVIDNFEKENYISKLKTIESDIELRKKIYLQNKEVSSNFKWNKVALRITDLTETCLKQKQYPSIKDGK